MYYSKEIFPQILFFIERVSLFSTAELLNYLGIPFTKDNDNMISGLILQQNLAYLADCSDEYDKLWITAHSFFHKREFAVTPTDFELKENIFIHGSRLMPFINPFVIQDNINISYKKKYVQKIKKDFPFSLIEQYYFLNGEDFISSMLFENCKENIERFCLPLDEYDYSAEEFFYITVFDFQKIYSELNIKKGDKLILRIEDWNKGIFSVKKRAKKEKESVREKWFYEFENGLKEALKILPIYNPVENAVAFTFFIKHSKLFSNSNIAMDDYFRSKNTFSVQNYGIEEKFWITDEDIPQQNLWISYVNDNATDNINFFFKLKLPISEQIIQAFIFVFMEANYIHYRNDEYKEKCIKELCSCFLHYSWKNFDKICKKCSSIIDKRYDFYIKKYNPFKYPELIELRKTAVSFFKEILVLINSLRYVKMRPDNFKNYSGLIINQLVVKLNSVFNYIFYYSAEDSMYMENVYLSLEHGYDAFLAAKTNIQNTLSEKGLNKF